MMIIEMLQSKNRTLLEVNTAAIFWAIAAEVIAIVFPLYKWEIDKLECILCIWIALIMVIISLRHMHRGLDRALGFDEGTASKLVFKSYIIRYMSIALILITVAAADILNPLVLCLAYLIIMKVAVYSQPFTHKFYNRLFNETDPIPEPLDEEPQGVKE